MTREETWDKAYKRLLELYGKNPDAGENIWQPH